ncbi:MULTISPECIES: hypothetical protein [unclassified Halomonas]|uniref:hypothetical protein n=1 Tax=unclassified Halomonas TaxID=2609666 RepID=UPI0020767DDC|nr:MULTISPECIES: hypothetical protein [unclassified Halomonas]
MVSYKIIIYQLTRPVSYLFIKHSDKYIYDWVVPSILLVTTSVLFFLLSIDFFNLYLLVGKISTLLAALPGFFIAALAAVATFNRLDIDKPMSKENPPKIETLINTQYKDMPLSRRRFLCMLFSFLTVQSIFLSFLGFIPESFVFYDPSNSNVLIHHGVSIAYFLVFFFFFFQLLTTTMHGLYYLGDKIHY